MTNKPDHLEPEAEQTTLHFDTRALYSIAISLKRIADVMERVEGEQSMLGEGGDGKRHFVNVREV